MTQIARGFHPGRQRVFLGVADVDVLVHGDHQIEILSAPKARDRVALQTLLLRGLAHLHHRVKRCVPPSFRRDHDRHCCLQRNRLASSTYGAA
jgi:hypothetical protein